MKVADHSQFFEALACVSQAAAIDEVLAHVLAAVVALGFERYLLVERHGKRGRSHAHHNAPSSWLATTEEIERHPIIRRSMTSPIPFVWGRELFLEAREEKAWARQAEHGYGVGICAAYGAHDSRAFVVVGANPDELPVEASSVYDYFGNLLLLAGACMTALERLAPDLAAAAPPTVKLRPRELECLHWVLRNKTAWEISKILGISERTVNQHLARARAELDVPNTRVAATRALQLELLPPWRAA